MTLPYPLPRETRSTGPQAFDGVSVTFGPFQFKIFDTLDVRVQIRHAGDAEWSETDAVTIAKVDPDATYGTFTATFDDVHPATSQYQVVGRRLHERSMALARGTGLNLQELEKETTKQGTILQELRRDVTSALAGFLRTLRAPFGEVLAPIPSAAERAHKLLAFDAYGQPIPGDTLDLLPEYPALEKRFDTVDELRFLTRGLVGDGETVTVIEDWRGGRFKQLSDLTLPHDGGIVYRYADGLPGGFVRIIDRATFDPRWWGMVPNVPEAAEANSDAFDAALNYWRNAPISFMTLDFPDERWWTAREHDLGDETNYKFLKLRGTGDGVCYLASTLQGQDKIAFRNGPTGLERANRVTVDGITFEARNPAGTACPILLWLDDPEETAARDCRFLQTSKGQIPGTLSVFKTVWNCDFNNCHWRGGGDYRPMFDITETVRFTLTASSTTVTATEGVFVEAMEGVEMMFGDPSGLWWGTIGNYVSPTEVELVETPPDEVVGSGMRAWIQAVKATTNGTNTITLSHPMAEATDIGRWLVLRDAGEIQSRRSLHFCRVTNVPDNETLVVDRVVPHSVSNTPIYFSPVIVMPETPGSALRTNDVTFFNCRVEIYRGVGLAIEQGVQVKWYGQKFHGAGPGPLEGVRDMSQAAIVGHILDADFFGVLEAAGWDDGRIVLSGSEGFHAGAVQCRVDRDKAVIWSELPATDTTTISLGRCDIKNDQHDMDDAGNRAKGYIQGPANVQQIFSILGPVKVLSASNKRLIGGGPTLAVTGISTLNSKYPIISPGNTSSFELPGSFRNGPQKSALFIIGTAGGKWAGFQIWTNGVNNQTCSLVFGDSTFWAGSNTTGATTASKMTVSAGGSKVYVHNGTAIGQNINFLPIA